MVVTGVRQRLLYMIAAAGKNPDRAKGASRDLSTGGVRHQTAQEDDEYQQAQGSNDDRHFASPFGTTVAPELGLTTSRPRATQRPTLGARVRSRVSVRGPVLLAKITREFD